MTDTQCKLCGQPVDPDDTHTIRANECQIRTAVAGGSAATAPHRGRSLRPRRRSFTPTATEMGSRHSAFSWRSRTARGFNRSSVPRLSG